MTTAPVAARTIEVRRPGLDHAEAEMPKHFVADDLLRSHIAAMLSSVFPEGEDFFVRSVRAYRDEITDPVLKEQVKGFIGQEALHGRQHRDFNDRLQRLGYPTRFVDRQTKQGLALLHKLAPKPVQLAVTAALEHYTATLAETLLRDEHARSEFGTPEIEALFTWHALEETEHKAVAYDVYQHVSGNDAIRIGTMAIVHVAFFLAMSSSVAFSLVRDEQARNPLRLLRSLWGLRTHPFFTRDVIRRLGDYNRRDFHPDDHDTEALLEEWRAWWERAGYAA
jgi:predicted metal-dependent hydrolase